MGDATPAYDLLDRLGVAQWLFFPRRDVSPSPAGAVDLPVHVAGARLVLRRYGARTGQAAMLLFHGNGEVIADYDGLAPAFSELGVDLAVVDYRGYGASTGSPTFGSLIRDAHAVWEAWASSLEAAGWRGLRFVYGRSLGGYPAVELAASYGEQLAGLVLESSAANLGPMVRRFLGEPTGALAELLLAHERRLAAIRVPVLVIHGERDEIVPLETAVDLFERLPSPEKELVVVPRAGHNDLLWVGAEQYFAALGRFVRKGGQGR